MSFVVVFHKAAPCCNFGATLKPPYVDNLPHPLLATQKRKYQKNQGGENPTIIGSEFQDYQIFITTYDKPWFEYARSFLEGKAGWKTMEFYAQTNDQRYEVPVILDNQDLIAKAERHLRQNDFKAAAVYIRSTFERIIRKYCEIKKKKIVFKSRLKDYTTEHFWSVVKTDAPIP